MTDNYSNNKKTDIKVTNPKDDKNVDAYVRVTLVPTWEDGDNAVAKKVEGLTYPTPADGWIQIGDYYYYTKIVKVGASTPKLFDTAITVPTDPQYVLNLQVLAEAIQADGVDSDGTPAVATVWPVAVNDGILSAK